MPYFLIGFMRYPQFDVGARDGSLSIGIGYFREQETGCQAPCSHKAIVEVVDAVFAAIQLNHRIAGIRRVRARMRVFDHAGSSYYMLPSRRAVLGPKAVALATNEKVGVDSAVAFLNLGRNDLQADRVQVPQRVIPHICVEVWPLFPFRIRQGGS